MIVIVCGSRSYGDRHVVCEELDELHYTKPITRLIHGGANGADALAGEWAEEKGIECRVFRADWEQHGKAAGPIRNEQMLREGKPDLVLAFPGGRGTADMVDRARRAGVAVSEVPL